MKSTPLACLFLMLASFTAAAQQFNDPTYFHVGLHGAEPAQIVTGDFNRDGNLDLAVADTLRGGVALLAGNGDGTFQVAKHLMVSSPYALAVADVNGDGNPDLLVQQYGQSGNLFVYLGRGDGTFRMNRAYTIGHFPIALAVGDLNGDGKLDVVVASSNSDRKAPGYITVFSGNGDGTFTRNGQYSAGRSPWGVAIGDLNGDGHPDIVVSSDNAYNVNDPNTLFVLLNDGNGSFTNAGVYQTGTESLHTSIADLNHDGKPDLVVASAFNQGIQVLMGNGDGTFAAPIFYSTGSFGQAPMQTVVADFNADVGGVGIFYGNGDGTFQPLVSTPTTEGGESIVMGDFNKDGRPDISISAFGAAAAGVMLNAQ
jgi:hypothetical protein